MPYKYRLSIFYFISFLASTSASAQSERISFEHLSIGQGLSNSIVSGVFQDSKGFLWIATQDGLNKFDGYTFTIFRPDTDNPNSLLSASVRNIYEDKKGLLWITLTTGGVNLYNPQLDSFYVFQHKANDNTSISNNTVTQFLIDSQNRVWLGTSHGLNRYDYNTKSFVRYFFDEQNAEVADNYITAIYEDQNQSLWVGTRDGLNILKKGATHIEAIKHNNTLSSEYITRIFQDNKGIIWVGTANGINRTVTNIGSLMNNNSIQFDHQFFFNSKPANVSGSPIQSIFQSRNGDLWIGTTIGVSRLRRENFSAKTFENYLFEPGLLDVQGQNKMGLMMEDSRGALWMSSTSAKSGVFKFDYHNNTFHHYINSSKDNNSLSNNEISCLFEDKSKVLWIGTLKGGLNKVDLFRKNFENFNHSLQNANSLNSNLVYSIYEDQNRILWVGTMDGLNKIDRRSKIYTSYSYSSNAGISGKVVGAIAPSLEDFLWLGYYDKKISKFYPHTQRFINYETETSDPKTFQPWSLRCIYSDPNGETWFGTCTHGLARLNKKGIFSYYKPLPFDKDTQKENFIWSIVQADDPDFLWLGTSESGLVKFNKKTCAFNYYPVTPASNLSTLTKEARCIYKDKSKNLWVGTFGGGLYNFDVKKSTYKQFTVHDGLPSNVVHGILGDAKGNLWISTNKGLSRFNTTKQDFKNYGVEDGLQGNEFNEGASFQSKRGEFFFGGINGVTAFYPDSIHDNPYQPQIIITKLMVFNNPVRVNEKLNGGSILGKSISYLDAITFNSNQNDFSFEFTAVHMANPAKLKYAYMMKNYDREWKFTNASNRIASYTNLSPGEYTFMIKASNNDGIWNSETKTLRVTILPYWWQTIWFKTIVALALGGLALAWVKIRTYNLKLQKKELESIVAERTQELEQQSVLLKEIDKMKTQFFFNISHELRTPLTLILGPLERLHEVRSIEDITKLQHQVDIMRRNGQRLSKLINQLLDIRKLEEGTMPLNLINRDIIAFVSGIVSLFEDLGQQLDINLTLSAPTSAIYTSFDADKMEKILYNLLSNAFKYTRSGGEIKVDIHLQQVADADKEFIQIIVSDNGVGIHTDAIPFVFDRFYQVENNTSDLQEGSGLGLSYTKDLITLHGGTITVKSEFGIGSEFVVLIPIVAERPPLTEHLPAAESMENSIVEESASEYNAGPDAPLLLIVEDNEDVRSFLDFELRGLFKILQAVDGASGYSLAVETVPDLIISDVMMPGMNGIQLCSKLKQDDRTSHIPIILLTAKSGNDTELQGVEVGADAYVAKPFSMILLKARIKNLIDSRKKLRRLYLSGTAKEETVYSNTADQKFLDKLYDTIDSNLADSSFNHEALQKVLGLSKTQLYRKLQALTGQTVHEQIRARRLKRAAAILSKTQKRVSEVAYEVGFNDPSTFSKAFHNYFGRWPSDDI